MFVKKSGNLTRCVEMGKAGAPEGVPAGQSLSKHPGDGEVVDEPSPGPEGNGWP